ncbi:hypothetical protein CCHR01_18572 [Colletotrichum chrysophilum]|uniref:Uncharacterized protein n=1 Tax=Colletotrichum chrysophilum TaxID=1836956 RepID=A0AAD9A048_9PEZI|nr:hypothetical protein CCHR01_18572 [Colletotrichum chrysophilum]
MYRYPCVNRYKHGVDRSSWFNMHGARSQACFVVSGQQIEEAANAPVASSYNR